LAGDLHVRVRWPARAESDRVDDGGNASVTKGANYDCRIFRDTASEEDSASRRALEF
jgi:hypothetical protein